jgi:hypothetical protein
MAVNIDPITPGAVVVGLVQAVTANTNRDGTGTVATLVSGGADGKRIDRITITGTGTTTAGVIRIYLYDGTNTRLIKEILVTAITPSTSIEVYYNDWYRADGKALLYLPPDANYAIKVSTHIGETFNVVAYGGSYTAP